METKSLILGLAFSMSIFAVKSGAGLAYLFRSQKRWSTLCSALLYFVLCYGLVFTVAWLLTSRFDLLANLSRTMLFFQHGMTLHLFLATLLFVWGLLLLQRPQSESAGSSRAWLLLVLPCPVCFGVIMLGGTLLHSLVPQFTWFFAWLFFGFIGVALTSAVGFSLFNISNNERGLGAVMMLVSLYFLVSIAVVPQFGDIERIYRIGLSSAVIPVDSHLMLLWCSLGLCSVIGFMYASADRNEHHAIILVKDHDAS